MSLRQLITATDRSPGTARTSTSRPDVIIEAEPGSPLEAAYGGPDNLADLSDPEAAAAAAAGAGVTNG